jgi:predicted dehydrogenase
MTKPQTIKAGVVGVGVMGSNHARVYTELAQSDLIGVYDENPEQAKSVAAKLGVTAFQSIDEMFDSGIQALTIAVPTSMHKDISVKALHRGIHLLVEKPIASTLADAEAIINAAEKTGRKLMIGHIERFNPVVTCIKNLIPTDEVIAINITRVGPLPPRIKDVGIIIDLGVHDIDLVRYLTGQDIERVYCVTSSNIAAYEDTASLLLDLGDGISAHITTNWIAPYKSREVQVITKERLIRGNLISQQVREFSRYNSQDESFVVRELNVRHEEPLKLEILAFLNSIINDTPPPITGRDGYETLKVAIQALQQRTR